MNVLHDVEIRADQVETSDEIYLPSGRLVDVDRVDTYGDGLLFIRWCSGPRYPRAHPLHGERQQLGSLKPLPPDALVRVRRLIPIEEATKP